MTRNKNIFKIVTKSVIAGAMALALTAPTIVTPITTLTTAYAATTSDVDYTTIKLPIGAITEEDFEATSSHYVKVDSVTELQRVLDNFKTDDTLLSGTFARYAPINNGEERVNPWGKGECMHPIYAPNDFIYTGETSHKQYGDFYATMSIRYPANGDTLFYGERLARIGGIYKDENYNYQRITYTDNNGVLHYEGKVYDTISYHAKCFENETIFDLSAKDTDAVKAKIQALKTTGASFTGTPYEKVKQAYNWTMKNTTYNSLGDSKTFASTFYWLCEGAGVDSMMYISDDESRVFNTVSLDGKNYLVDTYAAVDEKDTTDKYLCFAPASTDALHAVKISVASENYDPNAKKDDPAPNPGTPEDNDNDDNGNSSDDAGDSDNNDGSDDSDDSDGGSSSDSNDSASTPTSNYESGLMKTAVSDAYLAATSAPSVISNADTGVYAYDNTVKEAIQSVLPGYNVQSYINIATSAATGTLRMLTPVECLIKNPGIISGDVTAVKKYYLVYCNNGIVQILPNTSDSPYLITAPIYGSGNYAIVMAQ